MYTVGAILPVKKEKTIHDVLETYPWVYDYLAKEYQEDKEIAMTAVNNGYDFFELPEHFQTDKDVILKAVEWDGDILENMDESYLEDRDICLLAAKGYPDFFEELPEHFQEDREFVLDCIKANCFIYEHINDSLQADDEIIQTALTNGLWLESIANADGLEEAKKLSILNNRDIVLHALEQFDGEQFRYAGPDLRADKELILLAVKKGFHDVATLADTLRMDSEFMLQLIEINEEVFATMALLTRKDSKGYPKLSASYFCPVDVEFCKKAYAINKKTFKYMSKEMKQIVK